MLFRQLIDYNSNTYTYLIASDYGREAIIIDPVVDHVDHYIKLFEQLQLRLVFSLDTHTHADHVTGSGRLHQQLNSDIAMGERSQAREFITLPITDEQILNIDGIAIRAMYTPGHTDDCYSFVLDDRVFTGDTLMIRATGRTDFQSGDAHQQYDSIFNKLLKLDDHTLVYPAHDYNGMTVSSIGEEKHFNPRLQVSSADEYAEIMNNLNLPKPKQIDISVPANLQCGLEYTTKEKVNE